MASLKREFLELLKRDEEFRYAVIGMLDLGELRKNLENIWRNIEKLWREVRALRKEQTKLWQEVKALREEHEQFRATQGRLARMVERLTISVEEEALETVPYRLRKKLGVFIKVDRIFIGREELDIYGASDDICVFGETSVRLGSSLLEELDRKISDVARLRPDLLRERMVKLIYTDCATSQALEEARRRGVWVLNWKTDLTPFVVHKVRST